VTARRELYSLVPSARDPAPPHTEASRDPARPFADPQAVGSGRYAALFEIGRLLLEQREPAPVLEAILRAILRHLTPEHACLLRAGDGETLLPILTHGLDLTGPPSDWPLSLSVVRQVRESGLAVLASDIRHEERFAEAESVQRFRIRSVLCVALGRPPRGILYLDNRSERAFSSEDLEFLAAVALYASLALERLEEHAQTASALQASAERLDLLQDELLRHEIVGRSPGLLAAWDALVRFARTGARVLLLGETGTGKELFARAYAAHAPRRGGPWVPVPIPALAPGLLESELFGHVRGAFTEATRDKKGRLELADGGVLFLDEIGDVEPALQPKLLRFLDSGELHRVGDTQMRRVNALVVSATNRPLEREVQAGRFRADLLARLGQVVAIPPLRERAGDVALLAEHFLRRFDRGGRKRLLPETLAALEAYAWPLNVRELAQVVERAVCLVDRDEILPSDLPDHVRQAATRPVVSGTSPPRPLRDVVAAAERAHILATLEYARGNRRRAIELLHMSPETFYRRLEEYGLHTRSASAGRD
jgi:transcriptional regulator with GAF, ATPase, and Fis domain